MDVQARVGNSLFMSLPVSCSISYLCLLGDYIVTFPNLIQMDLSFFLVKLKIGLDGL